MMVVWWLTATGKWCRLDDGLADGGLGMGEMHVTILVVDDAPVNVRLFQKLLADDNYHVLTASTGQETLDIARDVSSLDLILLDVQLPDIDGIEVCRQLKSDAATEAIPIVLVSAVRTDDDSVRVGLDVGAAGFLVRPVDDMMLRSWVKTTLYISTLQRQLKEQTTGGPASSEGLLESFSKLSHDVNNPLQALVASADMLSLHLQQDGKSQPLLDGILIHAQTVAKLVAAASLSARKQLEETACL